MGYWAEADEVSDAIVALANKALKNNISPMQILVGLLLSYKALEQTMPEDVPVSLAVVTTAINHCLREIFRWKAA